MAMSPQDFRRELVDHDWTQADLEAALRLGQAWEHSPELRQDAARLDALRGALRHADEQEQDQTEPAGGWGAFEERLAAKLPRDDGVRAPWGRVVGRWAPLALAAAALALAVLTWWSPPAAPMRGGVNPALALRPAPGVPGVRPAAPAAASMTPQEIDQQARLFQRVAEVFDGRTKWVATSDHGSGVGLDTAPVTPTRLMLLRLAVLRDAKVLSRSDVSLVAGQDADLTLPLEPGRSVRYRLSATPGNVSAAPARLSLWIEVLDAEGQGRATAALVTELPARPGELLSPGELRTATGEYQFEIGFFEVPRVANGHGGASGAGGPS